mmetsp:Transcript_23391/g.54398  ORF Transcript_23391/g.54398 Transcript_23391/m.54398 type:complete len:269 (+) Transcript_23391:80-886(+)
MAELRSLAYLPVWLLLAAVPRTMATAPGAVKLDNYTFDKMLAVPGLSVAVKFDQSYAYGEKEDAFKTVCELAYSVPNFLIAEVPVEEYGDKINDDLRERFGLAVDEFPVYLLFSENGKKKVRFEGFPDPSARKPATWDDEEDGEWEPPMMEEINAENLLLWLRMNGVKMPSIGTIHELDQLAQKFMAKGGDKASILKEAEALAKGDYQNDRKAPMYTKIMQKVIEKGNDYVAGETARVKKLLAGKITEDKKSELTDKTKILDVFAREV